MTCQRLPETGVASYAGTEGYILTATVTNCMFVFALNAVEVGNYLLLHHITSYYCTHHSQDFSRIITFRHHNCHH